MCCGTATLQPKIRNEINSDLTISNPPDVILCPESHIINFSFKFETRYAALRDL
jgi:hypothetical protein